MRAAGVGVRRRTSSAPAGTTTSPAASRNQAVPASVPIISAWTTPSTQASAVKRCRMRQRWTPMRRADVVGEPEDHERPAGDDPDAHPQPLIARDERDRHVGQARLEVGVAQQRERVDGERHHRRQRERLVDDPPVAPAAAEADRDGEARRQQRDDAGGAAGDPERVLAHDWLVVSVEPSSPRVSTSRVDGRASRRWTTWSSRRRGRGRGDGRGLGAHRAVERDDAPGEDEGGERRRRRCAGAAWRMRRARAASFSWAMAEGMR